MRILVLGAAGFIGSRMVRALLERGNGQGDVREIVATDNRAPKVMPPPGDVDAKFLTGDLLDPKLTEALFEKPFDTVVHLAASLTLESEADFARGMLVNVHGLMRLLEKCRAQPKPPKLLFASSTSTFGGRLPRLVDDFVFQTPETSYGVHKVIAEQLINDYSRRGFLDGRVLRLPTVITHPGPPTGSVSDRIASLIREPLNDRDTECPIARDTLIPFATVDRVVAGFLKLHDAPASIFGATRAMNMPALSATPAQVLEAVERAKPGSTRHVRWTQDAALQKVVDGWPGKFTSSMAIANGILPDASTDELVANYLAARDAGY